MKVELDDILFWMDAIRNSDDRYRTLESFWKGQIKSKVWLVEKLEEMRSTSYKKLNIAVYGGWNGVLASLLFNSKLPIENIISIDIDPTCKEIAKTVNMRQVMEGRFESVTADMTTYTAMADIVINTSCEHITQEQYNSWLINQPDDALFVLQSNNYFELDEHVRCSIDLEDFVRMSNVNTLWQDKMELPKYNRFMIIGQKNV